MVSVVIINYNTFKLTCECIRSVLSNTSCDFEIILVDNASTECDPDLFKTKFPNIQLVKNPLNNGFAAGNNLGISKSKGDFILLLNSDTYLTDDAINKTVSYLKDHDQIGVIGCRMVYPDGALQYSVRRFRSIWWEIFDVFRLALYVLPYKLRAHIMLGKYFHSDFNTNCDWINGAFFMFRKEIIFKLPNKKLDERFFMYGEDHLWCWQIQQLGYVNYFYSETSIVHISGGSSSLKKQLQLRKTMMCHELDIMKLRKGSGVYFVVFAAIYSTKEYVRNFAKKVIFRLSGKLVR